MNYIDYFAKGGKTRSVNKKTRSENEAIELLYKISNSSSAEDFDQKMQLYAKVYGKDDWDKLLSNVQNASISDEELAEAYMPRFEEMSQIAEQKGISIDGTSSVFKCGGKMQRLSQRFAKGGATDCGCKKKIPMHQGGKEIKSKLPLKDQNYVQQVYNPDGSVEIATARTREELPENQRKNPESDYNIAGSDYDGLHGVVRGTRNGIHSVN